MSKRQDVFIPDYGISVALTSYFGARIVEMEGDSGETEEGIFIPFKLNSIKKTKGNRVYANIHANVRPMLSDGGYTHTLRIRYDKDDYKEIMGLGYKPPFIGSMWQTYSMNTTNINLAKNKLEFIDI